MNKIVYYTIIPKTLIHINKNETIQARQLLSKMLERLKWKESEIEMSPYGKPYFKDSKIHFNYSHSKNYIACAVSYYEVGIDIEETTRKISGSLSKKYLEGETDPLQNITLWVKKESYSKLKGLGIQMDIKNLSLKDIKEKNILIQEKEYICSIYSEKNDIEFQELKMM